MHRLALVRSFNRNVRVRVENTMIDRTVLRVGPWQSMGERDDLLSGLFHLSHATVNGDETGSVPFFQQRTPRPQFGKHFLPLRGNGQGQGTNGASPVVAGRLVTNFLNAPSAVGRQVKASTYLDGKFNPTRWIVAQRPIPNSSGAKVECNRPFSFAISPKADWRRFEIPYLDNNNVIIGDDSRFGYARSKPVEEHLRDYVTHTTNWLNTQLIENGLADLVASQPIEFLLGDIEFYWELSTRDPIGLIELLEHYITAISAEKGIDPFNVDFDLSEHRAGSEDKTASDNRSSLVRSSPSFWFDGRRGVRFKFYAKTNRRVRFEVSLSSYYRPAAVRRRRFFDITTLIDGVKFLKLDAVEMMNSILDDALASVPHDQPLITPKDFKSIIVGNSDNVDIARSILEDLRLSRRVAPYPKDPRYPTLKRLKKIGVLERPKSAPRVFTLVRSYWASACYPQPPIFRR